MRQHRLYVTHDLQYGATGTFTPDQVRQVRSVLRLRHGDPVTLFNDSGVEALAVLNDAHTFAVTDITWPKRLPAVRLTVGLALLRGERFETAVQKLTEVGVRRIVPLSSDRNVVTVRDADAWRKRYERLRRIAIEASEQSERVDVPDIALPATVDQFLAQEDNVIVLLERSDAPPLLSAEAYPQAALMIGPEGGWSEREVHVILESQAQRVTLGSLILRAETAAIVAAGTLIQQSLSRMTQRET